MKEEVVSTSFPHCSAAGCRWPFAAPQKGLPTTNTLKRPSDKGEKGVCAWKVLVFYHTSNGHQEGGDSDDRPGHCTQSSPGPAPLAGGFQLSQRQPSCRNDSEGPSSLGCGPPLHVGCCRLAEESENKKKRDAPWQHSSELVLQEFSLPNTVYVSSFVS